MIISVNWLKKFTDIDLPIGEFATLIGARLVEIEEVKDLSTKYKDVVIARVGQCTSIEGSDHLSVAKLDDGGKVPGVDRDEKGLVQVVCGASNVRAGMLVAWLPPNSVVPETFGDTEPFVLSTRKLRGVMSNGMIASSKELDLFDDHTGILEITDEVRPGSSFSEVYELDDYLLDIENKSLTHRPDTFGIVGFAREVAAIQGKRFATPEWLMNTKPSYGEKFGNGVEPRVAIDNPELSARYQAVVLSSADSTRQSPLSIQTYLARIGVRPINAVVDVTNYLMMLTGQPLHAFDYDKVMALGDKIHVRSGKDGETLELLDGRVIELAVEDIVIASGETAIGLAGAMGGANTAIDATTKNIILESATFNLFSLRGTQMRHGIFSEAITRFTKGQPPELAAPVLADALRLMNEWAGATRVSDVADVYPGRVEPAAITIPADLVNAVLGTSDYAEQMLNTLMDVEFGVEMTDGETDHNDNILYVTPPYWRSDIHIPEDVIEEIGRINSYDDITPSLPKRDFTAIRPGSFDEFRATIRSTLVRAGANEQLSYSFIHGDTMRRAGQNPDDAYRITNSLSPELQYYRQTLTPSLLSNVHSNIKSGYDQFALFELNKVHSKIHPLTGENVPEETDMIAFTVASKKQEAGTAYYLAKRYLDYMGSMFGVEFAYETMDQSASDAIGVPFEYRRSAVVKDRRSGLEIGIVGEYTKTVTRGFKLPEFAAGFELKSKTLFTLSRKTNASYTPLSRYPTAERDICFRVASNVAYRQIIDALQLSLSENELQTNVMPVDIYQPRGDETKNITVRVRLTARDHTLTGEEVATVIAAATQQVILATSATVI